LVDLGGDEVKVEADDKEDEEDVGTFLFSAAASMAALRSAAAVLPDFRDPTPSPQL
jgi:hypothetical protein